MKFLKKLFCLIIFIILVIFSVFLKQGYDMYSEVISKTSIQEKVAEIKSIDNYTKYSELPQDYINAVIAVEDKRFWTHKGLDFVSITRAIFIDIQKGSFKEGGSTITQQLAKNTYLTQEKKLSRKFAEIFLARDYEKKCSKEEIFEMYVNTSYFGDGYYCVGDASKGYFDKKPSEMNLYECTLLAGVPNAPSVYAPTKNPELAKERQIQVLKKMVAQKYLTQEQMDEIVKEKE